MIVFYEIDFFQHLNAQVLLRQRILNIQYYKESYHTNEQKDLHRWCQYDDHIFEGDLYNFFRK
jgi:hypothetical protein